MNFYTHKYSPRIGALLAACYIQFGALKPITILAVTTLAMIKLADCGKLQQLPSRHFQRQHHLSRYTTMTRINNIVTSLARGRILPTRGFSINLRKIRLTHTISFNCTVHCFIMSIITFKLDNFHNLLQLLLSS